MTDLKQTARLLLASLDLTSLNDSDTPDTIATLCQRAQSPFGPVAAVCVWPRFVAQARASLPPGIRVAAVANFPAGELNASATLAEIEAIAQAGAQEIDVVLPYRALIAGRAPEVAEFLAEVRHASQPLTLKVIIESGELRTEALICRATQLALTAGADFVKTSTGKTPTSATPDVARVMLREIAASGFSAAGFKASGGVRTVAQGQIYVELAQAWLGGLERLRIGASSLLDDIEAVLSGNANATAGTGY